MSRRSHHRCQLTPGVTGVRRIRQESVRPASGEPGGNIGRETSGLVCRAETDVSKSPVVESSDNASRALGTKTKGEDEASKCRDGGLPRHDLKQSVHMRVLFLICC